MKTINTKAQTVFNFYHSTVNYQFAINCYISLIKAMIKRGIIDGNIRVPVQSGITISDCIESMLELSKEQSKNSTKFRESEIWKQLKD